MKIGFTGTRHGMTAAQKQGFASLVIQLQPTEFHHGSCLGADVEAAVIVRGEMVNKCKIVAHPGPDEDDWQEPSGVDDETLPGKTHFARNRDIVAACDLLIACPIINVPMNHGGTWYTINHARKMGKPVRIVQPDGELRAIGVTLAKEVE